MKAVLLKSTTCLLALLSLSPIGNYFFNSQQSSFSSLSEDLAEIQTIFEFGKIALNKQTESQQKILDQSIQSTQNYINKLEMSYDSHHQKYYDTKLSEVKNILDEEEGITSFQLISQNGRLPKKTDFSDEKFNLPKIPELQLHFNSARLSQSTSAADAPFRSETHLSNSVE